MSWTIEVSDLPCLAAEMIDEPEAGAEPVTLIINGRPVAELDGFASHAKRRKAAPSWI